MGTDRPDPIVTDVQAPLETALIDEFLRSRGYDHTSVRQLPRTPCRLDDRTRASATSI